MGLVTTRVVPSGTERKEVSHMAPPPELHAAHKTYEREKITYQPLSDASNLELRPLTLAPTGKLHKEYKKSFGQVTQLVMAGSGSGTLCSSPATASTLLVSYLGSRLLNSALKRYHRDTRPDVAVFQFVKTLCGRSDSNSRTLTVFP